MDKPLATLADGKCRAEIFETALPGQFSVRYYDASGNMVAEEELAGVSSYKQREQEILSRVKAVCHGGHPGSADLADAGEY